MINLHHDSWNWAKEIGSEADKGVSIQRYKAIGTQLADYFKDYSDKVCFESLNEPQFSTGDEANQTKILEKVNTEFYNLVRIQVEIIKLECLYYLHYTLMIAILDVNHYITQFKA